MKIIKMEPKQRNVLIIFMGLALIFLLMTIFKTEKYDKEVIKKEIEKFHKTKDSTMQVVDDFVELYNDKKNKKSEEMDSLFKNLENNKKLSKRQILELKRKIQNKENVINFTYDTIVNKKDSIVYNIILKDTTVYNEVFKTDTIRNKFYVIDTIYKIDTLFYKKEQIKKIKFKN